MERSSLQYGSSFKGLVMAQAPLPAARNLPEVITGRSGRPVKVETWKRVLELHGAFLGIRFPPHHDEWGREFQNLKFLGKFVRRPDLAMLGFKRASLLP